MQDRLYIDGEWIRPEKGGTLDVVNPATEEVIHKAPAGTSGDIDKAVKAARYAFDSGPWPRLTGSRARRLSPRHRRQDRREAGMFSPGSKSSTTASRCPKRCGTSTMPPAASTIMPVLPRNSTHDPEEPIAAQ